MALKIYPAKASFVVYNKDGEIVSNYYMNHKTAIKLPAGGKLLILGSKNASFKVVLK